jgi:hypothetical protein
VVPKAGLEPARIAPPPPQDGVSTNSTTSAFLINADLTFTLVFQGPARGLFLLLTTFLDIVFIFNSIHILGIIQQQFQ